MINQLESISTTRDGDVERELQLQLIVDGPYRILKPARVKRLNGFAFNSQTRLIS